VAPTPTIVRRDDGDGAGFPGVVLAAAGPIVGSCGERIGPLSGDF
jgi:hypothetical protein